MSNMTTEFDEHKTRELAQSVSRRESRKSIHSVGTQGSLAIGLGGQKSRNDRMANRKSIIEIANKELNDFNMDESVLKELKHLRKQSRAHNTQHITINSPK